MPDGPSHRFGNPVRHWPAITIAMLTIGSQWQLGGRAAGIYAGIYGYLRVSWGAWKHTWHFGGLGSTRGIDTGISTGIYAGIYRKLPFLVSLQIVPISHPVAWGGPQQTSDTSQLPGQPLWSLL